MQTNQKMYEAADGIIDLRAFDAFKQGHLLDSTSLEFQHIFEKLNQLPAAPAKLFLVGDANEIEEVSIWLDEKGYQVMGSLVLNQKTQDFWQQMLGSDWVSGSTSKALWQPTALIKEWMSLLHLEAGQRLSVLDVGCGGGRDAVFMAKQRMNVTAIDQEARVIKRAKQLAQDSGAQVKFKCCDVNKADCIPDAHFDVVVGIRFLKRELFDSLYAKISPSGYLIWQTFVDTGVPMSSPKCPKAILNQGELAQVFASMDIIVDRIETLPDGRTVNSFIAQKRDESC